MKVEARNLKMQFNDAGRVIELFHDLSFEVPSGQSLAIMGQSGVGKTTLLYILGALEFPVSGDVALDGTTYSAIRKSGKDVSLFRGEHVGFIFQFHNLLPEFDAVENVAMPLLIRGENPGTARERATELLKRLGLQDRLLHRPGMLSGGEQQRVAIARALAGRPGVILADEPTGNLDQHTGGEVRKLLLELQTEEKITLILVTHSPDLASSMDRVVELTPHGIMEK